ncbi:hypothetical protein [Alkalihalobacillus sp. LMS39]|uniref:hypothetical protein n=1 Tax=Alkalihalobacillus sp. LMS39 TaxID=2924032 RepID=UPI001FB20932|nr:hypothetical protein [Alkalihalobacillus sp. LMS39]UOE93837.1 hypothetical protein MM271_22115 [Alkalihalobacillus sp. LMS39]
MDNRFTEKELLQILQQAKQKIARDPSIDAKTVINDMVVKMTPYIDNNKMSVK